MCIYVNFERNFEVRRRGFDILKRFNIRIVFTSQGLVIRNLAPQALDLLNISIIFFPIRTDYDRKVSHYPPS
jgi:hypothetical protein